MLIIRRSRYEMSSHLYQFQCIILSGIIFSITCNFEAQSPLYENGMVKEVPFIQLCTTQFLSGHNIAFLNRTENAMTIIMYVKQM